MGQVLAKRFPASAGEELSRYLTDYVTLSGEAVPGKRTLLTALVIYFRYPLLAFFLGFASLGVAAIPAVTTAYGFFLSLSVCCFTAAFGRPGILIALAVLGVRCLLTLPCYFLLAVPSLGTSAALASLSFGSGRRAAPVVYGRGCWKRLAVVCGVLLAGVCVELFLSPALLESVLERVLT
ncbi:hypothetical protein [Dysosmobacter sp.]|uniref:hypothetical protein n=1 Tax=Dysosmobacter sp. TaxID=2591382 RepID=UPI003FD73A09